MADKCKLEHMITEENRSDLEQPLSNAVAKLLPGAVLEPVALPLIPDIRLYLLNRDYPRTELDSQRLRVLMDEPLYWSFCWAAGQILAKMILQRPELVAGKRVLDFGSGSGVVAIAAAKAGAAEVIACDSDPMARMACGINAEFNKVSLTLSADYSQLATGVDLITAADVLYDQGNFPWIRDFVKNAPSVIVADSRIKQFRVPPYRLIDRQQARTFPDLEEDDEVCQVNIYRAG